MQHMRQIVTVIVALAVLLAVPGLVSAQDGAGQVIHTVQPGENLFRISLKYNTTVEAIALANNITNQNLIYVGQELVIPVESSEQTETPVASVTPVTSPSALPPTPVVSVTPVTSPSALPPTPVASVTPVTSPSALPPSPTTAPTVAPTPVPPPGEIVHVVQPGENLFRIALQYNLLASIVAAYNGIPNPNVIYVGQKIRIPPGGVAPVPTPVPTTAPEATTAPAATPVRNEAANVGFAYGIQVHLPNQAMDQVMSKVSALGMNWVEQRIDWALYEPSAGNINWDPIDDMVNAMDGAGLNILLSVSSAPGWARDSDQESGPPTDYQTYANFIGELAARYKGQVDAYEIWSEQNLRREWNTTRGISAASYVEMLRLAYASIKAADPAAIVVTGGLAPTGFNDGVNAIDDRVYLRQMYEAGVADWSDAIGAHPNGWANPPDSTCCQNNRPAVPAWDDHPSFFFKETLQDYREIMVQNGDSGTYIWPTEFGWGSNDGLNIQPVQDLAFVTYTSLDEQAQYVVRGYQLGREMGYIGPMFLWNLNFCSVVGVTGEQCLWSLLDPADNPRPAYMSVQGISK